MSAALRRLRTAIWWDARLQFRNGFYYAAGFVALVYVLLLSQVRRAGWAGEGGLEQWAPLLVTSNMLISTFYFVAGLVLLEKAEGTLAAQAVSPLRSGEVLAARLITLTALATAENLLVIGAAVGLAGLADGIAWLLAGMVLLSALYCLFGFIIVMGYASINEFLMPSAIYTLLLGLPLLGVYGLLPSPLWHLHPVLAPILLLRAAFAATPPAVDILYALGYGGLWAAGLFVLGQRRFERFVQESA